MQPIKVTLALMLLFPAVCAAQSRDAASPRNAEAALQAQQLIAKVRDSLGGEANLKQARGLSLSGKFRRQGRAGETAGEIKIDLLAPDKFLKTEESKPQPMVTATVLQAVNGDQVWLDRKVSRPTGNDDGSSEIVRGQTGRTTPVATGTSGMRGTVSGEITYRTERAGRRDETRTVLGMQIPTPVGKDRNTSINKIDEAAKASAQKPEGTNRPPGIENPDVKSTLENQLRKEFACLMFAWLLEPPASFPLKLAYGGEIKADRGVVEAIDISGPDQFAARLFVDQATSRPVMLSYGELIRKNTGYVVSAANGARSNQARPEDFEEIAVQLYFADYRNVSGVMLPFQIIKAINGAPVDEWKIEKYRVNPDLKPKKFEKK